MAASLIVQWGPLVANTGDYLALYASAPLSQGLPSGLDVDLSFVRSIILPEANPVVQFDIGQDYEDLFGPVQPGSKIYIEGKVISLFTGLESPSLRAVSIATSQSPYNRSDLLTVWDAGRLDLLWRDNLATALVTASGQRVGRWDSRTPDALAVIQATDADRPTWSAIATNGLPALIFDGLSDYLRVLLQPITAQPISIYWVGSLATTPAIASGLWDSGASNNRLRLRSTVTHTLDLVTPAVIAGSAFPFTPFVAAATVPAATDASIYTNGTLKTTGAHGTDGLRLVTFGANQGVPPTAWSAITLSEFQVYNTAHTPAQVADISAWLMSKWNIHP